MFDVINAYQLLRQQEVGNEIFDDVEIHPRLCKCRFKHKQSSARDFKWKDWREMLSVDIPMANEKNTTLPFFLQLVITRLLELINDSKESADLVPRPWLPAETSKRRWFCPYLRVASLDDLRRRLQDAQKCLKPVSDSEHNSGSTALH